MKKRKLKSGSALLITLLLMGLLVTITLGLSNLVIREISVTASIVQANQAFYAAEAGVEKSLGLLSKNGPGFEKERQTEVLNLDSSTSKVQKVEYEIFNQSDRIPDFADNSAVFVRPILVDEDGTIDCELSSAKDQYALPKDKQALYAECPKATFRKLGLNDTHIIPLYSVDESGAVNDVKDFMVQYYLAVKTGNDLKVQGFKLEEFDVLRWKLYGKPTFGENKTESIADIYPGIENNSEETPVCIGTNGDLRAIPAGQPGSEGCLFPALNVAPPREGEQQDLDQALWSAARECYMSDAGAYVTNFQEIKGTQLGIDNPDNFYGVCMMRDFIDSHKQNYLVLTNLVNPSIVGISNVNDPSQLARADIFYRVLTRSSNTTGSDEVDSVKFARDRADIISTGYSQNGGSSKTLQVKYKKPAFLPVFNFSLYAAE